MKFSLCCETSENTWEQSNNDEFLSCFCGGMWWLCGWFESQTSFYQKHQNYHMKNLTTSSRQRENIQRRHKCMLSSVRTYQDNTSVLVCSNRSNTLECREHLTTLWARQNNTPEIKYCFLPLIPTCWQKTRSHTIECNYNSKS